MQNQHALSFPQVPNTADESAEFRQYVRNLEQGKRTVKVDNRGPMKLIYRKKRGAKEWIKWRVLPLREAQIVVAKENSDYNFQLEDIQ